MPDDPTREASAGHGEGSADRLCRFLFEAQPLRGHWVRLGEAWRAAREHQALPPVVLQVLGEAMAAVSLLAASLKFRGTLTLQIQGPGALPLLVAQASEAQALRAMARLAEGAQVDDGATLPSLVGEGQLVVSVENGSGTPTWQGIVPLTQDTLAGCLEDYFENSEQLPTRIRLAADAQSATGMLLQKLPTPSSAGEAEAGAAQQLWDEAALLLGTVKRAELLGDEPVRLLGKLFAEHDVRLFDAEPVHFRCRCDRPRVAALLTSLGEPEVQSIVAEQGAVTVTCEFCSKPYRFDAIDVQQLFDPAAPSEPSVSLN